VTTNKLSISLDADLVADIRAAAAEEGVTISAWVAQASEAAVRNYRLGQALRAVEAEVGPLDPDEGERWLTEQRRKAVATAAATQ
jgi:hypothetical protein